MYIHSYVRTVPLNYNYTRGHVWCHAVFHVLIPKIAVEIYISTRRDVALPRVVFTQDIEFTHDMEFTQDGNMTFSRDKAVLTKLSNLQDSTCL